MPLVGKFTGHGLGQSWYEYIPLWPSEREADPCAPSPPWCDYTPGSDYIAECQPIDPVACQQADYGPALKPEYREQATQAGDVSTDAYLRMNPQQRRAWDDYQKRKECMESGQSAFLCDYGTYLLWGSVALVGVLILSRR